jgi:hypothetical protein
MSDPKNHTEKLTPTQATAAVLNALLKQAPEACQKLLSQRVEVPSALESVTVIPSGDKFKLGILGVLNGVLVKQGEQRVAAMFDENETLVGFAAYPNL